MPTFYSALSVTVIKIMAFAGLSSGLLAQSVDGIVAAKSLTIDGRALVQESFGEGLQGMAQPILPRLPGVRSTAKTRNLIVEAEKPLKDTDLAEAKDVLVKYTFQPVALPPGVYGKLVIQGSRVYLGEAGSDQPSRYDFESIEVIDGGYIDLVSPAIVTTSRVGTLEGVMGRADLPQWLDLRVSGSPLNLGSKAKVFASVYAPMSLVTVAPEGRIEGWLGADSVTVQRGGTVQPRHLPADDRSAESRLATYPQRALLVQARFGRLAAASKSGLGATIDWSVDIPRVTLTASANRKSSKPDADERMWFFQSCCALFSSQGLDGARIVFPSDGAKEMGREASLEIQLTRADFEAMLWAVSGEEIQGEGIRKVEASPLLQSMFFERGRQLHRLMTSF